MCRIFGFRSVIQSQVHGSLVAADNALGRQSNEHRDGWGVAYYLDDCPHLTRSDATAISDKIFHRLSGVVASETVLAHVRRATVGKPSVLNCHPFQYGRWTFAHNGEIANYAERRDELLADVAPRWRRFILGDTDSEVIFFLFLTNLSRFGRLSDRLGVEETMRALRDTVQHVRNMVTYEEQAKTFLTIVVTDGSTMAAIQSGKELHWSTHKTRCSERETCPHLDVSCEAPTASGPVNHLLISSEPLQGENVWTEMKSGDMVGVDWRMRLTQA